MAGKKFWSILIFLLVVAVLIHIFSYSSVRVENQYSLGIYPEISHILKSVFGWLPFSFGDIIYGLAALWILIKIFRGIWLVYKEKMTSGIFYTGLKKTSIIILLVYILFNLLWGINYNRIGIAGQLGIKREKYSNQELKEIDSLLLVKVNESKKAISGGTQHKISHDDIFKRSMIAYDSAKKVYPFLQNRGSQSLKSSMWGWLGNYLGFTGYYNPFTGESQVNTTIPVFLQPFTTCHEIAHQLGYAKENEANFVGYLAAVSSNDTFFHYSVYLDLLIYANRSLYLVDSVSAKSIAQQLLPEVREDLLQWRNFNKRHQNPVEPFMRWAYGKYLEGNQQPSGVLSYDEVTGYLIAYRKKYGKI